MKSKFKDEQFKENLIAELEKALSEGEITQDDYDNALKRIEHNKEIDYWYIEKRCFYDPKIKIKKLNERGEDYLLKSTSESTEIIVNHVRYVFLHSKNFKTYSLFLFGVVKKEAQEFIRTFRGNLHLPPQKKVNKYNYDYDDSYGEITGTDINHAYWRIAFNKGIISEKTYNKGLKSNLKATRLSTLSVLGRPRRFTEIINGERKQSITLREGDLELQKVYQYIRYSCYMMMDEIASLLGEDFESYNTDCIYYRDSPENQKLVHQYLDKYGFTYKQLYFEVDEEE